MKGYELNLEKLNAAATALDHLLPQVTFVGGCTTILLVDKAAFSGVRQTEDVDVIVDITTSLDYHKFGKELRKLGFQEDQQGPICRWLFHSGDFPLKLDVMPIHEHILGFSNRWYPDAIRAADEIKLSKENTIKVVNPAYFLATKLEAFYNRGKGDYFSHDLEDIIFVMENRHNLIDDLMNSPPELKAYFSEKAALLLNDDFLNVLPGLLENQDAADIIFRNLKIMSTWK